MHVQAPYFHSPEMKEAHHVATKARRICNVYGRESSLAANSCTKAVGSYATIRRRDCSALLRQTCDVLHLHLLDYLFALEVELETNL